ncbi:hypothetical protein FOA52_013628 [Chlamydomonas sp. UWO 241]|nr:hypothetical protein FOA52_013628 [Chlamydomonas sp. UWO 241]
MALPRPHTLTVTLIALLACHGACAAASTLRGVQRGLLQQVQKPALRESVGVPNLEEPIRKDVVLGDDCAEGCEQQQPDGGAGSGDTLESGGSPIIGNVTVDLGDGAGDLSAGDAPNPVGPVRLYAVTQWNSSAALNKTVLDYLVALEEQRVRDCLASVKRAWSGPNANDWLSGSAALWGSFAKVLDFDEHLAYEVFTLCSRAHAATPELDRWQATDGTAVTPGGEKHALVSVTDLDQADGLYASRYVHVSLVAVPYAAEVTALAISMELAAGMSGAVYGSGADVSHARYLDRIFPNASHAPAVAQMLAFKEPQGALAYYFYKSGRAPVPRHPLFARLEGMTGLTADVEFLPVEILVEREGAAVNATEEITPLGLRNSTR